jgi:magnesium chelatase family protein
MLAARLPSILPPLSPRELLDVRLSGPFIDRIDLQIEVPAVSAVDLILPAPAEGSAEVAARVAAARELQRARYSALGCGN